MFSKSLPDPSLDPVPPDGGLADPLPDGAPETGSAQAVGQADQRQPPEPKPAALVKQAVESISAGEGAQKHRLVGCGCGA